jgi:hypothetical protein
LSQHRWQKGRYVGIEFDTGIFLFRMLKKINHMIKKHVFPSCVFYETVLQAILREDKNIFLSSKF